MEERKRFAKDIRKMFGKKMNPLFAIEAVIALIALAGSRIPNTVVIIIGGLILLVIYMIVLHFLDFYVFAEKIMYCRALVGKEISDDPVKEGCDRVRNFGNRNLKSYRRKCGRIMYTVGRGAITVGNLMEQIPGLDKVSGIYKKLVKRLLHNSSHILVTYQLGCYEDANEEQFYDLVTYFVQDGKSFLAKTVKSEAKEFIGNKIAGVFILAAFLGYAFTKSIILAGIGIILFVVSIIVSVNDDDFNILCDYIEYVQSHELNMDLREKLVLGIHAGNTVLDFTRAYNNPTEYNMRRAINSVGEMAERFDAD